LTGTIASCEEFNQQRRALEAGKLTDSTASLDRLPWKDQRCEFEQKFKNWIGRSEEEPWQFEYIAVRMASW